MTLSFLVLDMILVNFMIGTISNQFQMFKENQILALKIILNLTAFISGLTLPVIICISLTLLYHLILKIFSISIGFKQIYHLCKASFIVLLLGFLVKVLLIVFVFKEPSLSYFKVDLFYIWYSVLISIGIYSKIEDNKKRISKIILCTIIIFTCVLNFVI
ncbi:hypothetical protein CSC2_45670 [Clostridium zeae]|uniref:Yip1 domain-containing protein n=1 Tax=Clostridium zeae TaxID=2759022 RepID=A0ABQ1EH74_9CLOT|nr:hypothetical protein CSC2_45670 [Clostridium zeae]